MPPSTRRPAARLLAAVPLAVLAWGCVKPKPAEEEGHPAPVRVAEARTVKLAEWTELVGATQPLPEKVARVSAAVESRVLPAFRDKQNKPVKEGDPVRAGQPLIQLDDTVARAGFEKAEASLKDLKQQQAQAHVAAELADIEVKRLAKLIDDAQSRGEKPLVSAIELQKARLAYQDAQSREEGAAARGAAAAAELRGMEAQRRYYTPASPIDGRVGQLQVTPGQSVPVGTVIADVVNLDEIDVLCYVPPAVAARLAPDMPARLGADAAADGRVAFVAQQGQPETGLVAVKVRFPNDKAGLRANTVVRVQVRTRPEADRLVIPASALMEDSEPPTALVVVEETRKQGDEEKAVKVVRRLKVSVGVRDRHGHLVEVLGARDDKGEGYVVRPAKDEHGNDELQLQDPDGKEVELFVAEGGHGLKDGDEVKVEEEHDEGK
jgi:RND family efflux transporter MFP subunit